MFDPLTPEDRRAAIKRFAEMERETRRHETPAETVQRINYARALGGRAPITLTQYVRAQSDAAYAKGLG